MFTSSNDFSGMGSRAWLRRMDLSYLVNSLVCCSGKHQIHKVKQENKNCIIPWSLALIVALCVAPQVVATGTFLNPDTTRVIAKRIILTGHPFKVHKKTATVRYMFFNSGMS
jgi:hypothetical protein